MRTSKSRTELCYSRYMTINNGIATRDLPTHGWKNINGAGAVRRGLVGSVVTWQWLVRLMEPLSLVC